MAEIERAPLAPSHLFKVNWITAC